MPAAVPVREDFTAAELRALASKSRDARQCARLLALAGVAEGRSRLEAARLGGMDRQTLRDWVHRFNQEGPAGLIDRKSPGAPAKVSAEQKAELAEIVERGPDVARDGVVRWRRIDLQQVIKDRFGVDYHERSVSRLLHELGFAHMSARPYHPGQEPQALEDFKKTSPSRSPRS